MGLSWRGERGGEGVRDRGMRKDGILGGELLLLPCREVALAVSTSHRRKSTVRVMLVPAPVPAPAPPPVPTPTPVPADKTGNPGSARNVGKAGNMAITDKGDEGGGAAAWEFLVERFLAGLR